MAVANLVNVGAIRPKLYAGDLTTSDVELVDVDGDDCIKIESIFLCNADAANSCTADLQVSVDNGSNYYYLCSNLVIPPSTTISVIDRPIFLDETDIIRGSASANGDIDYIISGQITTD